MTPLAAAAPRSNTDMQRIEPASTLRADAFDAPAPAAIAEAAKAAQGGGHQAHQSAGSTTPSPQPAAAVYTCPMHPEVTSDQPGTCPRCGMALVKKN
ncbi:MAG TPA: heavy metal-binding domain-containing protein [Thermoanaerobaculia bacterium]|nr:heavy metal-binding domain-containing protein [Thermoanaerobaculia bacterium]